MSSSWFLDEAGRGHTHHPIHTASRCECEAAGRPPSFWAKKPATWPLETDVDTEQPSSPRVRDVQVRTFGLKLQETSYHGGPPKTVK